MKAYVKCPVGLAFSHITNSYPSGTSALTAPMPAVPANEKSTELIKYLSCILSVLNLILFENLITLKLCFHEL